MKPNPSLSVILFMFIICFCCRDGGDTYKGMLTKPLTPHYSRSSNNSSDGSSITSSGLPSDDSGVMDLKNTSIASGNSSGTSSGANSNSSSRNGTMNRNEYSGHCGQNGYDFSYGFPSDGNMSGSFILMSPTSNTQQAGLLAQLDEANR